MCGRVVWVWDEKTGKLLRKFVDDPELDPEVRHVLHKERYNVPPASHLPVIDGRPMRHGEGARMAIARWGFPIPKRPNGVFNTRIETAAESPMWRGILGQGHCLFPVQGFYEWRRDGKRGTPFYIHRKDGEPMLLAGLVQDRKMPEGSMGRGMKTFGSVVTCAPNGFMAELHDRMPVILEADAAKAWLAADKAEALELAVPAGDMLARHQVSDDVNDTKNDEPRLIAPVGQVGLGAF